jgi:5-oxoprolinase (ATP-hydrolysing)
VVEPGWQAEVDVHANLILTRTVPREVRSAIGTKSTRHAGGDGQPLHGDRRGDGGRAQNTASSVNIKERLDFSCAIFDAAGALIANAPHIPVHLGSMGDSIRTIIEARGERRDGRGMKPGDVYALNAPYRGGTHLPDVTVIMPVFADDGMCSPPGTSRRAGTMPILAGSRRDRCRRRAGMCMRKAC